ncbi:hypothetical protein C0993_002884 [Termitomyces sp. T159_Od127]|nr:hypothetical protein C0993_002884 [Termitomyces sp. T159_Od127]
MPTTFTLPDGVEYVAASLLSTVFVLVGHNINVGKWRKRSGIKYPQLYAEKAEVEASRNAPIFNCAQRAHANTLENIPVLYVTTLITAVKYPIVAATACGVWSLSRVFYTRGYLSGDPSRAASRPSFPTSSTDFALPSSSVATTSSVTLDDPNVFLQRFRRPSILAPKSGYLSESRLHSPLASSFTLHSRRRSQSSLMFVEEPESDKERMLTDSSSASSENSTPPLKQTEAKSEEQKGKFSSRPPLTPPRKRLSNAMDVQEPFSPLPGRRLSFPLKPPRILNLLAESRPEENEVKSEAAFQRLIHSCSELPVPPRTPRVAADRGRYPEEASREESQREDTPSDDDEQLDDTPLAFSALAPSAPIAIQKPHTSSGSVNGDDFTMSTSASSSFGTAAMDVDLVGRFPSDVRHLTDVKQPPGSPMNSTFSTPLNHWRYTPPPTTSAVRSNKRKRKCNPSSKQFFFKIRPFAVEDRFDPYTNASKRRAVSPSMSYLRDNHSTNGTPLTGRNTRLPISIPVNIPSSTVSSAASSPTISNSYPTSLSRPVSMTSSPTLRASMVSSPILRPVPRHSMIRKGDDDEREVQGAGDAVGGLTLE